jgi:hypothetical protein
MKEYYYTLDNGAEPYMVRIIGKEVRVYKNNTDYTVNESFLINVYHAEKIWIGVSPLNKMTEFSGGHGERFNGNSILIKLENDKYIYIGDKIKEFNSKSPIVEYVSPVGNNCVPYPYAIDELGNYYLMIENTIIKNYTPSSKYNEDPYGYMYENQRHIREDMEFFD